VQCQVEINFDSQSSVAVGTLDESTANLMMSLIRNQISLWPAIVDRQFQEGDSRRAKVGTQATSSIWFLDSPSRRNSINDVDCRKFHERHSLQILK
jgi:hypothetical protein